MSNIPNVIGFQNASKAKELFAGQRDGARRLW
jgi:hypothetical protein